MHRAITRMMDMAAVLEWVQKNIANFGGDPKRVTIDGESAGSMLVSAMVGSPEGKGLFQRAIAQSGAWMGINIGHMTTRAQAEENGQKMVQGLGAASIAELRAKPADELLKNSRGPFRHCRGRLVCTRRLVADLRESQRKRRGCSGGIESRRRDVFFAAWSGATPSSFPERRSGVSLIWRMLI